MYNIYYSIENEVSFLKQKNVVLALILGTVVGFFIRETVQTQSKLSPDKALKKAKDIFKSSGPINGSWIYMKPEKLEKNGLVYETYRGGISRNIDGDNKQYDFYIDTKSGVIIDSQLAQ